MFWQGAWEAWKPIWMNLYHKLSEFSYHVEDFGELLKKTSILASSSLWFYKACLEVFQLANLAEILGECIKFDFAKIIFQPRGCRRTLTSPRLLETTIPLRLPAEMPLPVSDGNQQCIKYTAIGQKQGFFDYFDYFLFSFLKIYTKKFTFLKFLPSWGAGSFIVNPRLNFYV